MSRHSSRLAAVAACCVVANMVAAAAAAAAAASPTCSATMALEANVEAGEHIALPALTCTDPGGDTVYIEPTQLPSHGTMHPAGRQPVTTERTYTADGDAGGLTDTIRFRAVGGRRSNQITLEIPISAGHVPVCPSHLALQVYAGQGIVFAQNPCTDDDCDPLTIVAVDTPAHGAITMAPTPPWTYMPAEGFVGDDVLTYRARDARTESNLAVLGLYVVPWPYLGRPVAVTPPAPDLVPPTLSLAVPRGAAAMPRALTRGVQLALTAREPFRCLQIRLLLSRREARRLRIDRSPVGPIVVGRLLTRWLAPGRTTVTVELSRQARRRLVRVRRVKLRVEAKITDEASNIRRVVRRIKLRRTL